MNRYFNSTFVLFLILFFYGCISVKPNNEIQSLLDKNVNEVNGNLKVTYYGVSTLLFDDGKTQILIDCFFSRYSLLRVGMSKIKTNQKQINALFLDGQLGNLKAVFTAHSHYDHAMDVGYISNKSGAVIYGSSSTLNIARGENVSEDKLIDFTKDSMFQIGRFLIEVIPSKHSVPKWYNDDLGEEIGKPLVQPVKFTKYKEGGAFDFLIHHGNKSILIRPSFSTIEGQWRNKQADYLFLGITGMDDVADSIKGKFYDENVTALKPKMLIPVHHDDFFRPIHKPQKILKSVIKSFDYLASKTKNDTITFKLMDYRQTILINTD